MGRSALIEFLDTWRVIPEYTFRQGVRRTWLVRATTIPHITKVQHDQGLAVVKEAQPQPPTTQQVEKFVEPTEPRSAFPASRKVTPPPPKIMPSEGRNSLQRHLRKYLAKAATYDDREGKLLAELYWREGLESSAKGFNQLEQDKGHEESEAFEEERG